VLLRALIPILLATQLVLKRRGHNRRVRGGSQTVALQTFLADGRRHRHDNMRLQNACHGSFNGLGRMTGALIPPTS
jgi:hypothetical protein